jgi:hypothetical protein
LVGRLVSWLAVRGGLEELEEAALTWKSLKDFGKRRGIWVELMVEGLGVDILIIKIRNKVSETVFR